MSSTGLTKMLQRYKSNPADVVTDAKLVTYKRMAKQSAYLQGNGYMCSAIKDQLKNTTRKQAIGDKHTDALKERTFNGHVNFVDLDNSGYSDGHRSFTSLKGLVDLHKAPLIKKQNLQPNQTATDFTTFNRLPLKDSSRKKPTVGDLQREVNVDANRAALQEIKQAYLMSQSMMDMRKGAHKDILAQS